MRLIDADTFKENMERKYGFYARQPQDDIDAQPTVDAMPVVHAHWIEDKMEESYCSNCFTYAYDEYDYCPHCLAKMDEKIGGQNES